MAKYRAKPRFDAVDALERVRPLRDQIVVLPDQHVHPTLVLAAERGPTSGVVVAVGPGARVKRRERNADGDVIRLRETGRVIPMSVKVGDRIHFGKPPNGWYTWPEIVVGATVHYVMQEADVCFIEEPDGGCSTAA